MADSGLARERLMRRVVWLVIGVAVLVPIIWPFPMRGVHVAPEVRQVFEQMEAIPAGGTVVVAFDFELGSRPELEPMALAVCRHAFARNVRVIGVTLWVTGSGLADQILAQAAREFGKEYGRDYVFLGWNPGSSLVILSMGQDIYKAFPKDAKGNATRGMKALDGIGSLRDVNYVMAIGAGTPGPEAWITYGSDRYGFALGGGCTGVIAPQLVPFVQTGQLKGFLGAMKGGAEYEGLLLDRSDMRDRKGAPLTWNATAGMISLSFAHFALLGLIVIGNVAQWVGGRKKGA